MTEVTIVELAETRMRPIPETGDYYHLVRTPHTTRALCNLLPRRGWEPVLGNKRHEARFRPCPECLKQARIIYGRIHGWDG